MRVKKLLFALGFIGCIGAAGYFAVPATNTAKDTEVRKFVDQINSLTDAIVAVFDGSEGDDEARLKKAGEMLDQQKGDLSAKFNRLKESGNILVSEGTEQALSEGLYVNSEKLKRISKKAHDDLKAAIDRSKDLEGVNEGTRSGKNIIAAYTQDLEKKKKIAAQTADLVNTYNSIIK